MWPWKGSHSWENMGWRWKKRRALSFACRNCVEHWTSLFWALVFDICMYSCWPGALNGFEFSFWCCSTHCCEEILCSSWQLVLQDQTWCRWRKKRAIVIANITKTHSSLTPKCNDITPKCHEIDFYMVLYISGCAGFLPSNTWCISMILILEYHHSLIRFPLLGQQQHCQLQWFFLAICRPKESPPVVLVIFRFRYFLEEHKLINYVGVVRLLKVHFLTDSISW